MAIKVSMSQVWEARRLVLAGWSVKQIAVKTEMSEGTVRNYTKFERNKMKSKVLV